MNASTIHYHGETYAATGKVGTTIATGEASAEYESVTTPGKRVWLTASGTVLED